VNQKGKQLHLFENSRTSLLDGLSKGYVICEESKQFTCLIELMLFNCFFS